MGNRCECVSNRPVKTVIFLEETLKNWCNFDASPYLSIDTGFRFPGVSCCTFLPWSCIACCVQWDFAHQNVVFVGFTEQFNLVSTFQYHRSFSRYWFLWTLFLVPFIFCSNRMNLSPRTMEAKIRTKEWFTDSFAPCSKWLNYPRNVQLWLWWVRLIFRRSFKLDRNDECNRSDHGSNSVCCSLNVFSVVGRSIILFRGYFKLRWTVQNHDYSN